MTAVQLSPDPHGPVLDSGGRLPVPSRGPRADSSRGWMVDYGSRRILGMRVDGTTYQETTDAVTDMAATRSGGVVCVANVHMIMEAFDDPEFQQIVNSADLVTPDGVPIVAALRMLGIPQAERVYGPSLTPIVCERAAELGLRVGFYGGSQGTVTAVVRELSQRFPTLEIPFAYSPPFRPLEEAEDAGIIDAIEAADLNILFVGLGCPKQERWMAEHRAELSCVMLGVGAAFDFIAGTRRQAPRWMQRRGLEWLFRLFVEPRRLWRRYLIGNPRFLYYFARECLRAGATASVPSERHL